MSIFNYFAAPLLNVDQTAIPQTSQTNVAVVMGLIYTILGGIAVIVIIWAGIQMIISSGNSEKVATARKTIIYAFVGLVIVIVAAPITGYIINAFS